MLRKLKEMAVYSALIIAGITIDQVITSQNLDRLREKLEQKFVSKGDFIVAEVYQSPSKDQFYIIRLGANPEERVDSYNLEIYLQSLIYRYFPKTENKR